MIIIEETSLSNPCIKGKNMNDKSKVPQIDKGKDRKHDAHRPRINRPFKSHAQSSIKAEAVAVTVYKKDDSKTAYHNSCVVGIIKRGTNHDGS